MNYELPFRANHNFYQSAMEVTEVMILKRLFRYDGLLIILLIILI